METKDTQRHEACRFNNVENQKYNYNDEDEYKENNLLLMYILQSRAEKFIECFESVNNRCYMGVLSLHFYAYANKLLLSETDWKSNFIPVVEKCRAENEQILKYLESIIEIPSDYEREFAKILKSYARYDDEDDFDYMLYGSLDELIEKGYRKIDCVLFAAGVKFKFRRMINLLTRGANPYVYISGDCISEEALYDSNAVSLYESIHLELMFCACNPADGLCSCWKDGFEGRETWVTRNLINSLFLGAGCQMVLNIIHRYARMNPE
jgi:hypothetical protein